MKKTMVLSYSVGSVSSMSSYKYRLVKEKYWRFELLPNNSNCQYVGKSSDYESKEEALKGLDRFKSFLNEKNIDNIITKTEIYETKERTHASLSFEFSVNGEYFSTRDYYIKGQELKGLQRILSNYNCNLNSKLTLINKGE